MPIECPSGVLSRVQATPSDDRLIGYRLGPHVVDLTDACLWTPAGRVHLRPQAFALLRVLAERAPALVTLEDIRALIWGHHALSRTAVPQAIRDVRRALGDCGTDSLWIETRHRRGYRLKAMPQAVMSDPGTTSRILIEVGRVAGTSTIAANDGPALPAVLGQSR